MTDDTFRNDAGSPFANRSAPACDYHDLPLVCGECGVEVEQIMPPAHGWTGQNATYDHHAIAVHRIPDPEFDTVDIVPCGLAP